MQPASTIQTEFDFASTGGLDASAAGASPVGEPVAYPSDEEILGITPEGAGKPNASGGTPYSSRGANGGYVIPSGVAPGLAGRDDARNPSSVWPRQDESQRDSSAAPAAPGLPRNDETQPAAAQGAPPDWLRPLLADAKIGPEATKLWAQHQAYRAIFPGGAREAQALKQIFPGGAREAQEMAARANEFSTIDRAYFSGEPRAQGELANWLLRDNPEAFRAMLQQGARVLADRDPAAFAEFARAFAQIAPGLADTATAGVLHGARQVPGPKNDGVIPRPVLTGTRNPSAAFVGHGEVQRDSSVAPAPPGLPRNDAHVASREQSAGADAQTLSRPRNEVDLLREQAERARAETGRSGYDAQLAPAQQEWAQLERARGELRAEQLAAFHQSANDAVVEHVRGSIAQTLGSVLPTNVSDAARERLAEAVFHEINTTLQRDPALTEQVAAVARSWRFDAATRQQVVDLIARRARQMVAPVAKRVVGEWTAGLVGAHRARSQRIEQAAARVDLAGGGAPETVSRRALSPRELDYTALTDEQILSL